MVSLTQYYTATILPRRTELRLGELGRNGDFASARFSVVRA
jgi:hypothetical protein